MNGKPTWTRIELWTVGTQSVRLAETVLRVDTFVPDRIAVTATLDGANDGALVVADSGLRLSVRTRWRTGEPAACANDGHDKA